LINVLNIVLNNVFNKKVTLNRKYFFSRSENGKESVTTITFENPNPNLKANISILSILTFFKCFNDLNLQIEVDNTAWSYHECYGINNENLSNLLNFLIYYNLHSTYMSRNKEGFIFTLNGKQVKITKSITSRRLMRLTILHMRLLLVLTISLLTPACLFLVYLLTSINIFESVFRLISSLTTTENYRPYQLYLLHPNLCYRKTIYQCYFYHFFFLCTLTMMSHTLVGANNVHDDKDDADYNIIPYQSNNTLNSSAFISILSSITEVIALYFVHNCCDTTISTMMIEHFKKAKKLYSAKDDNNAVSIGISISISISILCINKMDLLGNQCINDRGNISSFMRSCSWFSFVLLFGSPNTYNYYSRSSLVGYIKNRVTVGETKWGLPKSIQLQVPASFSLEIEMRYTGHDMVLILIFVTCETRTDRSIVDQWMFDGDTALATVSCLCSSTCTCSRTLSRSRMSGGTNEEKTEEIKEDFKKNILISFLCAFINCTLNKYFQFFVKILDSNDVHKGSMLHATPEQLQYEHYVFAISPCMGVTICYIHSSSINLIKNLNDKSLDKYIFQGVSLTAKKFNSTPYIKYASFFCMRTTKLKVKSKLNVLMLYLDDLHRYAIICKNLLHDIELNPGPPGTISLTIITLNCRGLGKVEKTRLTLNKINTWHKGGELIAMLQETMITTDNYIKLAWRGKYVLTPGTGNSKGCLTLLRDNVEILSTEHINNRGHIVKIKGLEGHSREVMLINIYAPNGFALDKTAYFDDIFQHISEWDGDIIMGGDFNLTFSDRDRFKRGVTPAENRLAVKVTELINEYRLTDTWGRKKGYTWRKKKIMSKLDRILFRSDNFVLQNNCTDWTLTTSDHAAVIATFRHVRKQRKRNEHVKLDNDIIKTPELRIEIENYLTEQLATADHMNPHAKLDFAKMTVRTKTLEIMKRQKEIVNNDLKEINAEIQLNIDLMTRHYDNYSQQILVNEIEELTRKKDSILQKQGAKLASFAKSKWFNEGEKSNKYFLNLLKRIGSRNEMAKLIDAGIEVTDESEIRRIVGKFYNDLYNTNEEIEIDPTFFGNMFTVEHEDNISLERPITVEELWLNLKHTKATTPGPDGLSNTYLKKLWSILGPLIVEAWNFSLRNNELPPSHKQSLLRLIPKAGKDTTLIKNWRPITLSNCDHKLITRTFNARLLTVISKHITTTQTAYIKGRNISDNLRLLGSAVKLADYEENVDATAIALDAQKAFDSVSHEYISKILEKCGLTSFIPTFKLLYKDLHNDIIINGKIGKGYKIGNGVKQGDALSCSLFLLAIEPVIRNINANH